VTAQRPGALIVDANERSAVAACEALARGGYRVGTASSLRPAPAEWSRFSHQRFPLPNPREEPLRFATAVGEIAATHSYDVALPCSEGSLWALANNRRVMGEGPIGTRLPSGEVVARSTSKAELLKIAPQVGFAAPETVVCANHDEVEAAIARVGYPFVLKPRRTVFDRDGAVRHLASAVVETPDELEAKLALVGWPCLVQRHEQGAIVSIGGVRADGELLGLACSRYARTWPPDAGSVCFSRTFEPSSALVEALEGLLAELAWEGIFELELAERDGGELAVLDFNPRIYGSLALAVRAGAPLPAIWCEWVLAGRKSRGWARPGVSYRWTDADLRYAVRRMREGRWREATAALWPRRRVAHPYFRLRDPLPALVRAIEIASGRLTSS
jgi:predicted ATP-grasp superfamily ATP-dependent carboligase